MSLPHLASRLYGTPLLPVLFGTRVIRQANVVWYGDVKTTEIRQSSGSGGKK